MNLKKLEQDASKILDIKHEIIMNKYFRNPNKKEKDKIKFKIYEK